jgi:hypothetical protein
MRNRRFGTVEDGRVAPAAALASRDDAERQWLLSVFDALSRGRDDVDSLLAFRNETRIRRRTASLARWGERRRSPGRRLSDLLRAPGRAPAD